MDRIIQLLINAAALYAAVFVVPNLDFDFGPPDAWWKFLLVAFIFGLVNTFLKPILRILLVAFIFGLVNTFLKPILRILTLPITLMTLGIFLIVINALLLILTGAISDELGLGLTVGDFLAAVLGSIVISVVGFVLSMVVGTSRIAGRAL